MTDRRLPQQLVHESGDQAFVELVVRHIDGCLEPSQFSTLIQHLRSSPEHRNLFAAVCLHLQQLADVCASTEAEEPVVIQAAPWRNWWGRVAMTAAAVMIVATLWWTLSQKQPPATAPGPAVESVALLTNTDNAVFEQTPGPMALGNELSSGPINLVSGLAQVMLKSGAVVDLIGPAQIRLDDPMRVTLIRGQAAFLCPSYAKGFTVALPGGANIEDLGTAFRVKIEHDQPTRVKVTEGHVRITHAAGAAQVFAAGQEVMLTESGFAERRQNLQTTRQWTPAADRASAGVIQRPFEGFTLDEGLTIEAAFRVPKASAWDNSRIWSIFRCEQADRVMLALQDSRHIGKEYGPPVGDSGYPGFSFGLVTGRYHELDVALDGRDGRPMVDALFDGAVHHVVAVYDRVWNTKSLYLDGQLIATTDTSALGDLRLSTTGATAEIGQSNAGERFGGDLLGVRIYDGALTVQQIEARTLQWRAASPPAPLNAPKPSLNPPRHDTPSEPPSTSQHTPQETTG